jgi:hypothetical protein
MSYESDVFLSLSRWRERIVSPLRFLNRCSRQRPCSVLPSCVSSLPNPEVLRKNQINSLSERCFIHSINGFPKGGRQRIASEGKCLPGEASHSHPAALEVSALFHQLDPLVGETARSVHDRVD